MNTFGTHFRMTTFGESHGPAVGCIVDGCPPGIPFDLDLLRLALQRRRPGQPGTTERNEPDEPEVLSGVFEGETTGTPIAIQVRNRDQRSTDYDDLRNLYRPSHADYTYQQKYGIRDHRGGGRSSARETLARVAAGAVARMAVTRQHGVDVVAAATRLGSVDYTGDLSDFSADKVYTSDLRMPDPETAERMLELLEHARSDGDSVGGIVSVLVRNMPVGVGDPIYAKLNSLLALGMMSINGAVGFEVGDGFEVTGRRGSANNDQWTTVDGELRTVTNHGGGVSGGISNGMPLRFSVGFKPPSSIATEQSHGTREGGTVAHAITGRHDPSIVIRAVSVVEAMTWLVLADRMVR